MVASSSHRMSFAPPPLPRKPASYSPTFLATQRLDDLVEDDYDEQHPADWDYDTSDHPYSSEYDRDFSLDHQFDMPAHPHSRPSSNGSAYGRQLPDPPVHDRMTMPEWCDPYDRFERDLAVSEFPPQVHGRQNTIFPTLQTSQSQSSLDNSRPLPAIPVRQGDMPTRSRIRYQANTGLGLGALSPERFDQPAQRGPGLEYNDYNEPLDTTEVPYLRYQLPDYESRHDHLGSSSPISDSGSPRPYNEPEVWHAGPDAGDIFYTENYTRNLPKTPDFVPGRAGRGSLGTPSNNEHHYLGSEHTRQASRDVADLAIPSPRSSFNRSLALNRHHDLYNDQNGFDNPYFDHSATTESIHNQAFSHRRAMSQMSFNSEYDFSRDYDAYQVTPSCSTLDSQTDRTQRNNHTRDRMPTTPGSVTEAIANDKFVDSQESSSYHPAVSETHIASRPINDGSSLPTSQIRPPVPKTSNLLLDHTSSRPRANSTMTQRKADHLPRSSTASALSDLGTMRRTLPHTLSATAGEFTNLLPPLPNAKNTLSSKAYEACSQPWSRSSLFKWGRDLALSTSDAFLESYSGLFSHTVPTLSPVQVHKLSYDLLESFIGTSDICRPVPDQTDIRFGIADAQEGVLPLLTTSGCYSSRCQSTLPQYRCYSSRCSRTIAIKQKRQSVLSTVDTKDWAQYWDLKMELEPLASLGDREIQRQYQIHEVIYSEADYLRDLMTVRDVFSTTFVPSTPADSELFTLVFGQIPSLIELSQSVLDSSLRERQAAQGPVVQSIGDIFLHWIQLAKSAYIDYASQLKYADRAIRAQRARNPRIRSWLALCEQDPRLKKLDFTSFQGSPTRRLQRYALLLADVLKKTLPGHADYHDLETAITTIKSVCQDCDRQVKMAQDKILLMDLGDSLVWKVPQRDLGLSDSARQIHHHGDLQRKSESLTSWQTREVFLLDNYLLCLKTSKDGTQKIISRQPTPLDYLVVDDYSEVLYKSSSSRILGGTITHAFSPGESTSRRPTIENARGTVPEGSTSPGKASNENLYPFTIRHAGKPEEKMTFFAETAAARSSWIKAMFDAKAYRWQKVCSHEPFDITILARQSFGRFSGATGQTRPACGASSAVESALHGSEIDRVKPLTFSRVQCTTLFRKPNNEEVCLIGTDDGIYSNYHGDWRRLVSTLRVSQIAVLEDFGVLTVLADKTLIAYPLDDILNVEGSIGGRLIQKPPQKLSGSKDVGFFEVGVMKERLLVVYKKRENGNSVFKALEPVIGKKQEKKTFFKKGTGTDFFRDFDVSDTNLVIRHLD